ncbi:hypothetical protein PPERSA_12238 [Pseudocohnilembus persalinus]|uniref:Lipase maturation factor 2 n=1 Tax=Pseudocohnilembus persalinus TaxID=266149 RepID=A0A0V0R4U8_PSEPJ|nr:hypothetical protein PPERSA_12238 [Pseudocohnilembus persalinus]|eukprot:KRX09495.1 hypothetical protein PPERSA_12238 [Pseudocohnilembus persalinus]
MYQSIIIVGQSFAHFQWDTLLLEVGFLGIFFVPKQKKFRAKIYEKIKADQSKKEDSKFFKLQDQFYVSEFAAYAQELIKFVAFKLFLSSGLLKLLSKCPTWWNLTALEYHFWSQPLPHYLSWYFNLLPDYAKKMMVAGNFICLLGGSLLFYMPYRPLRITGAFLNFIMQLVCVVDDLFLAKYIPKIVKIFLNVPRDFKQIYQYQDLKLIKQKEKIDKSSNTHLLNQIKIVFDFAICAGLVMGIGLYFFPFDQFFVQKSKLAFNYEELRQFVLESPLLFVIQIIFAFCMISSGFYYSIKYYNELDSKFLTSIRRFFAILFAIGFYFLNVEKLIVPLEEGQNRTDYQSILSFKPLEYFNQRFFFCNSYGLFRRMTGIKGREELVFEGSINGQDWLEYEFQYKPTYLQNYPSFAMPFQPRLDWQLWFSAMRPELGEPYLVILMQKILKNSESVQSLFKVNPFEHENPQFIRIKKYLYKFTNLEEYKQTG